MKKYILSALVVLITVLIGGMAVSAAPKELRDVQNYQIFYNEPNEEILNQMKNYDLVIIEPHYYTKEMVERIRANGTAIYAYLNVMEADNWNHSISKNLKPEDFFYRNGQKIYFDRWDSYLVDITSNHYQELLIKEVQQEIAGKGFDGIFLDTVGNIDDQHTNYPSDLKEQREGLVQFLDKLKVKFGSLSLVQNWGFATLKTSTIDYMDGIMWESFEETKIKRDQWSQDRIKELQSLSSKGLSVLTVSFKEPSHQYAWSKDFIHTYDPDYFDTWTYNQHQFKKPTIETASVQPSKPSYIKNRIQQIKMKFRGNKK